MSSVNVWNVIYTVTICMITVTSHERHGLFQITGNSTDITKAPHHRPLVDSSHKGPVIRKASPCHHATRCGKGSVSTHQGLPWRRVDQKIQAVQLRQVVLQALVLRDYLKDLADQEDHYFLVDQRDRLLLEFQVGPAARWHRYCPLNQSNQVHQGNQVDQDFLGEKSITWCVNKWKHFPRYWPFVRGIHRSPVNSPHKGQWRGALMFSDLRLNKRLNIQSSGWWFETISRPLWCHYNELDHNWLACLSNCLIEWKSLHLDYHSAELNIKLNMSPVKTGQ